MNGSDAASEIWYVRSSAGSIRAMTLDELDAAFKADEVGAETFVRKEGTREWATLGHLAGLETPDEVALAPDRLSFAHDPPARERSGFLGTAAAVIAAAVLGAALTASTHVAKDDAAEKAKTSFATGGGAMLERPLPMAAAAINQASIAPARRPARGLARPALPAKRSAAVAKPEATKPEATKPEAARPEAAKAKDPGRAVLDQLRSTASTKPVSATVESSPFHEGGDEHDPLNGKL